MTFAEKLQELREEAGLSQSELARASGVSVWSLRGYEQGRREPLWDVIFPLARALGVSCEAFAECVKKENEKPAKRNAEAPATPNKRRI